MVWKSKYVDIPISMKMKIYSDIYYDKFHCRRTNVLIIDTYIVTHRKVFTTFFFVYNFVVRYLRWYYKFKKVCILAHKVFAFQEIIDKR